MTGRLPSEQVDDLIGIGIPLDRATSLSDLRYRCMKIDLLDLETPVELPVIPDSHGPASEKAPIVWA